MIDGQDEAHEVLSKIVELSRPSISFGATQSSVDPNAAISLQGPAPSEPRTSTQHEGSSFEEKHEQQLARPQRSSISAVAADSEVAGSDYGARNEEFKGLPPPAGYDYYSLGSSALPATVLSGAVEMKNDARLPDSGEAMTVLPIDQNMLPGDGETEGASSAADADSRQGMLSNHVFRLS